MVKAKIGFIGAGFWAISNHIPIMASRNDVEMAAVCRLGMKVLLALQEKYGFPCITERVDELLKQPLDAVVITSPNHLHYEHAKSSLNAGLHVMLEKPMTLESHQSWDLVRIAEKQGKHILVPLGWNYKPFMNKVFHWLQRGSLGNIRHVSLLMGSPTLGLFEGTGGYGEMQLKDIELKPESTTWANENNGGGYANGQLVHALSLMTWLTGLRAESVYGQWNKGNSGVDLYNAGTIRFQGGAIGIISGTGSVPQQSGYQVDLRITGTEGMLLLDIERERAELRRHDGNDEVLEIEPGSGAYECVAPVHRFVDLITGASDNNQSSGESGARAVEIIAALRTSAKTGKETGINVID